MILQTLVQKEFAFLDFPKEEKQSRINPLLSVSSSEQALQEYRINGFTLVRSILPQDATIEVWNELKRFKSHWWVRSHFSQQEIPLAKFQSWRNNQVIRKFWFHHPLLPLVQNILQDGQKSSTHVRFLLDIATGSRGGKKGFSWHNDVSSFGLLKTNEPSVSIWCPFWDENEILSLNSTTGGGLAFITNRGQTLSEECRPTMSSVFRNPNCTQEYEKLKEISTFNIGDCVIFDKTSIHRTDPFQPPFIQNKTMRYAVTGRFTSENAIGSLLGSTPGLLPHEHCIDKDQKPQNSFNIQSPCYPRIYPANDFLEEDLLKTKYVIINVWNQIYAFVKLHGFIDVFSGLINSFGIQ